MTSPCSVFCAGNRYPAGGDILLTGIRVRERAGLHTGTTGLRAA